MLKPSSFLPIFLLLLLAVPQALAQPKLPFYDWGVGPCEYCLYGEWTVTKTTPLFRQMGSQSKVAYVAKGKEKLTAITGVVVTTRAGLGKALEATILQKYHRAAGTYSDVKIHPGETFYILTYRGEGLYTVWFKGQLVEASLDLRSLLTIRKPRSVWWVKIRNKKGQTGWTQMVRNFTGPRD